MTALLAEAPTRTDWPAAAVYIAMLVLAGFLVWCVTR